ncbi:hypothetical protein TrVE_jg7227 [Triparma verrucosa]|uniref:subtilisin n=1 Tax=Triparma verrucosa TaxID=1606542 RepID=A0A9W7BVS6_9STRA|nr:hypothetical protein TrVE_jg7227 [Triparma verrucosa]
MLSTPLQPLLLLAALGFVHSDNTICKDTANGARDNVYDPCSFYEGEGVAYCGGYDDADFDANMMCCGCGGGEQVEITPPSYINDPGFKYQEWYLGPSGSNVVAAWDAGYTGKGVQIFIMDDGLDYTHPDFSSKFRQEGSYRDPMPGVCKSYLDASHEHPEEVYADSHGTTCGAIATADDNDQCGVGVAFDATVSATNLFRDGGSVSAAYHAIQRGACNNVNHVSSNSWGIDACTVTSQSERNLGEGTCPFDKASYNKYSPCKYQCDTQDWSRTPTGDCMGWISTYCSASSLHTHLGHADPACSDYLDFFVSCSYQSLSAEMTTALLNGVTYGREGKGIVYVFAAGNEFMQEDDVNYEGWLNSMYTITVGAIAGDNKHSSYSSAGAPVLVSAQGGDSDQRFNFFKTTPVAEGSCSAVSGSYDETYAGVGTSYATPIVSGVVALMLEANPNLGWRDVQDILVNSAVPIDLDNTYAGWAENGEGLRHSNWYGFGKVDALGAVNRAKLYPVAETNVEQTFVAKKRDFSTDLFLPKGLKTVTSITVDEDDAAALLSVQHISVYVTASHNFRGRLQISLTSPSGMTSVLSPGSSENEGMGMDSFQNWKFTTVRNWGERGSQLTGEWVLMIENEVGVEDNGDGELQEWTLVLYGSGSELVKVTEPTECLADDDVNWGNVVNSGQCHKNKQSIADMQWSGAQAKDEVDSDSYFPDCLIGCGDSTMTEFSISGSAVDFIDETMTVEEAKYCPAYLKLRECYYQECPPALFEVENDDAYADDDVVFQTRCGETAAPFLADDDDAAVSAPGIYGGDIYVEEGTLVTKILEFFEGDTGLALGGAIATVLLACVAKTCCFTKGSEEAKEPLRKAVELSTGASQFQPSVTHRSLHQTQSNHPPPPAPVYGHSPSPSPLVAPGPPPVPRPPPLPSIADPWISVTSADGKRYYVHRETNETVWQKPTSK